MDNSDIFKKLITASLQKKSLDIDILDKSDANSILILLKNNGWWQYYTSYYGVELKKECHGGYKFVVEIKGSTNLKYMTSFESCKLRGPKVNAKTGKITPDTVICSWKTAKGAFKSLMPKYKQALKSLQDARLTNVQTI